MGIYEDIEKAYDIQICIAKSFLGNESTPTLVKRVERDVEKGKKAFIGEIRTYNGVKWRKVTETGNSNKDWVRVKKGEEATESVKPQEKKEEVKESIHLIGHDVHGKEVKPRDVANINEQIQSSNIYSLMSAGQYNVKEVSFKVKLHHSKPPLTIKTKILFNSKLSMQDIINFI